MFQSFTGSSRRPRQVNLSGRNSNPFAAASASRQPSSTQTSQHAVAHAQQERLWRQQERERLQATKLLQRAWRGHKSRREIKSHYRQEWDRRESIRLSGSSLAGPTELNISLLPSPYREEEECLTQLKLLVQFVSPRCKSDVQRVHRYVTRFSSSLQLSLISLQTEGWPRLLSRLVKIITLILTSNQERSYLAEDQLKELLVSVPTILELIPQNVAVLSMDYYHMIGELLKTSKQPSVPFGCDQESFSNVIMAPLKPITASTISAYEAFAREILTLSEIQDHLRNLNHAPSSPNYRLLATALKGLLSPPKSSFFLQAKQPESLLWLFAYFISFHDHVQGLKDKTPKAPDADYIYVISTLLSHMADSISSRIDASNNPSNTPMSGFVRGQILTLVDQQNITSLLACSDLVLVGNKSRIQDSSQVAILASYALTLLRVFPRRGDEIRMRLYMGSTLRAINKDDGTARVPAIRYFWDAVMKTHVYKFISQHPRNAIELLGAYRVNDRPDAVTRNIQNDNADQEWRIILLFFELYTFVLKVMDDEEFISGGSSSNERQSWTRQSALALSQVKELTLFLKNLAFSMYWNSGEILGNQNSRNATSLTEYFSGTITSTSSNRSEDITIKAVDLIIAGVNGMNLSYLKGMVTGLLRMIYERDSRRSFLSRDHWLMTNYFDMEGLIPAVVAEEDYKHQVQEDDEATGDGFDVETDEGIGEQQEGLVGTWRVQEHRRLERLQHQQRQSARRKHLEAVTPRLEILQNMPFFIPFSTRVAIFRHFIAKDQTERRGGFIDADQWRFSMIHSSRVGRDGRRTGQEDLSRHHAKVRRQHVFDDAYHQFYQLGDGLKEPIQITFVDQFDTVEAGIDGGGVTKEFLTSVSKEAFNPRNVNLFVENDQHLLYPNPASVEEMKYFLRETKIKEGSEEWNEQVRDLFRRYEFLGRIIGKCLYEGILVDIHFAPFFLVKWALTGGSGSASSESGYRANLNDLRDLDEGLYQGLLQLKNYPGNVADFSLDFTVTDTISSPTYDDNPNSDPVQRTLTRDLRPGGADIPVTNDNRLVYISYMARHRLQIQPHLQTKAFLKGLSSMIKPSWLSMFNQSELQTLLGGDSSEIDVSDLRRNTLYGGVYVIGDDNQEHPSVERFWEVMQAFSDADRRKVLKYVTSTPRAPLLGFSQLNPRFSIRDSGSDQSRLPSTSTCVNLLKLPIYASVDVLRDKLLYAINAGAGFNLS